MRGCPQAHVRYGQCRKCQVCGEEHQIHFACIQLRVNACRYTIGRWYSVSNPLYILISYKKRVTPDTTARSPQASHVSTTALPVSVVTSSLGPLAMRDTVNSSLIVSPQTSNPAPTDEPTLRRHLLNIVNVTCEAEPRYRVVSDAAVRCFSDILSSSHLPTRLLALHTGNCKGTIEASVVWQDSVQRDPWS